MFIHGRNETTPCVRIVVASEGGRLGSVFWPDEAVSVANSPV